jgi:hypothetical protein
MHPDTWAIDRRRAAPRAPALARPGATIRALAEAIGLGAEPDQWPRWLTAPATVLRRDGLPLPPEQLSADVELAPGQVFEVPNRVLMVWAGDLGWLGRWAVRWQHDRDYLGWRGLLPTEMVFDRVEDGILDRVLACVAEAAKKRELHGLFVTGHGSPYSFGGRGGCFSVPYVDLSAALTYRLALVAINACQGGWSKSDCGAEGAPEDLECGGRDLVSSSPAARFHGLRRLMIPRLLFFGMDTGHPRYMIRPGDQGTRG